MQLFSERDASLRLSTVNLSPAVFLEPELKIFKLFSLAVVNVKTPQLGGPVLSYVMLPL